MPLSQARPFKKGEHGEGAKPESHCPICAHLIQTHAHIVSQISFSFSPPHSTCYSKDFYNSSVLSWLFQDLYISQCRISLLISTRKGRFLLKLNFKKNPVHSNVNVLISVSKLK